MRLRRMRDEELAAASVLPVEGDADDATEVRLLTEIVANCETRTALSVAPRIAALDDEVGNDAVEGQAVVEPIAGQRDERFHRQRRIDHRELDLNRAAIGIDEHMSGDRGRQQARRLVRRLRAAGWSRSDL